MTSLILKHNQILSGVAAGLMLIALNVPGAWGEPAAIVSPAVAAAPKKTILYEGFQPLAESMAYRQYQRRTKSDLSRLVFLIDRFAQSKVEIIYDGFHFPASQAAGVARWFLSRNYKKQTPEQWIYQWCNTTVPRGKIILVKLPDGSTELGREVLLGELAALEAVEKTTPKA
ncbi:MAG: hypothetical protein KBC91_06770 [Candidatus Omnitrophica bacterium]|nr:hypothetical protein [Candidatus Omnitrophota bacterium]